VQERSKEDREAELILHIKEAVGLGLKVLDSDFDKLDVNVGDSESEDETSVRAAELIFEPKVSKSLMVFRIL
jgi:hypothetical protein